jgi:hypothetical protein
LIDNIKMWIALSLSGLKSVAELLKVYQLILDLKMRAEAFRTIGLLEENGHGKNT